MGVFCLGRKHHYRLLMVMRLQPGVNAIIILAILCSLAKNLAFSGKSIL
jgi:hypothetical protein